MVGSWQIKLGGQLSISPTLGADGSFQTCWRKLDEGAQTNATLYEGYWVVTNKCLISTITNISGVFVGYTNASGSHFTNTVQVGHVAHYQILEATERQLVLLNENGSVHSLQRIRETKDCPTQNGCE